jgi:hypothetical protein
MIIVSDLITSIQATIAGNTFLSSQLGTQVTMGQMAQQSGTNQTVKPYCVIYNITGENPGAFGNSFLDTVVLQFSVWTISSVTTSNIINAIALLFNGLPLSVSEGKFIQMKRASQPRGPIVSGQDSLQNFVYTGSVDFACTVQGN